MTVHAKVAVLLATYNGSQFLPCFLESLTKQSHSEFILFVRDDCSTDDTLDILQRYCGQIDIRVVPNEVRLGAAKNFMALLENSGEGFEYYSFADQDDYWHESKLERALNRLSDIKDIPALYCSRLEYVDEKLQHIKYSRKFKFIGLENALVENIATGCTTVINQEARSLVLSCLPRFYIMHDWWLYLVVTSFGEVVCDDFPTIKYRQHGGNTIGAATNIFQDFYRRMRRFLSHDKGIFGLYAQTNEFKICYSTRLRAEQTYLVDRILFGKKGLIERFYLCVSSPFVRQKYLDTLILRFLFLINRY